MEADDQAFQPNAPAPAGALASVTKSLPEGYFAFLTRANGGEGFIGDRYVRLWRAEELAEMNRAYNTEEFFADFFVIGGNGGGGAYAFDRSGTDRVFEVPFVGLRTDARPGANSFDSFLATLDKVNE